MRGGRAADAVVRRTGVPKQKSNKLYILRMRKENFFLPAGVEPVDLPDGVSVLVLPRDRTVGKHVVLQEKEQGVRTEKRLFSRTSRPQFIVNIQREGEGEAIAFDRPSVITGCGAGGGIKRGRRL